MNVFADLARPILSRPGDSLPNRRSTRDAGRQGGMRSQRDVELIAPVNPWRLTPCQAECLQLIADGLERKDIAKRLGLSIKTVDGHMTNTMAAMSEVDGTPVSRVRAVVLWDRFTRQAATD